MKTKLLPHTKIVDVKVVDPSSLTYNELGSDKVVAINAKKDGRIAIHYIIRELP